jgi:hypothetical protein
MSDNITRIIDLFSNSYINELLCTNEINNNNNSKKEDIIRQSGEREETISDMHMTYIILLFERCINSRSRRERKKKLFYHFILFVVAF